MARLAALVYVAVSAAVVGFQFALAAGAPWGEYAVGGASPGQFSPALRIGAVLQAALLSGMAVVVVARAGLALAGWAGAARRLIWVVLAVLAVTFVLNLITPSGKERAIWAPTGFVLLGCCAVVAFQRSPHRHAR
jgi:hypothetical protein